MHQVKTVQDRSNYARIGLRYFITRFSKAQSEYSVIVTPLTALRRAKYHRHLSFSLRQGLPGVLYSGDRRLVYLSP